MTVARDRGRWRYRTTAYFSDGTPTRISGSAHPWDDTREAAVTLESEHVARVRTLLPGQEDATEPTSIGALTEPVKAIIPTVQDLHGVYLESCRIGGAKPSTMASKEGIFRTHILPRLGDMAVDKVVYAVIEDFKLGLAAAQAANTKHHVRTLAPKTIHNVLVCLSDFLGYLRKREVIAAMPQIDWIKIPTPEFDFLDFGEADALITAADGEWRTMILTATRTGMRQGELLALEKTDLDLSAGRAYVRRNYVDGHFVTPKSGKGREIPLGEDVRMDLAEHVKHNRGPLVFCDAAGQVLTSGKLAAPLLRACKGAKLGREIGWHVLRHTFASHLAMRGVPLKVIQELLGHASIVTTMRYAHLAPHVVRDAVRLLDRAPVAAPTPNLPGNPAPDSSPAPAILVEVAKDWPNPADDALTN
jgi:site-specific recombinase XerD